jgi:hypothetical protein
LPLAPEPSETSSGVAQLVALQETSLALVGTLLTLTIDSSASATPVLERDRGRSCAGRALVFGGFGRPARSQPGRVRRTGRRARAAGPSGSSGSRRQTDYSKRSGLDAVHPRYRGCHRAV